MRSSVLHSFISIIIVCSLLVLPGCQESYPDALPTETSEGKNTLGFKLDGSIWVAYGKLLDRKFLISYDPDTRSFRVSAFNNADGMAGEIFKIDIDSIDQAQTFIISATNPQVHIAFVKPDCEYSQDAAGFYQSGTLVIKKFSTDENVISGTFELDISASSCDTLHITEGRFDLKIYNK